MKFYFPGLNTYVQSPYSCSQNVCLGLAAVRENDPALISGKQA